jgi:formylglycine-generating enzyme required for sulfatase activity
MELTSRAPPMIAMSALDILFWILILTLACVVYAVEDGLAMRHRGLVFTTMFSVVASCSYIMLGLDHAPAFAIKAPTINLPTADKQVIVEVDEQELARVRSEAAEKRRLAAQAAREPVIKGIFSDCDGCPSMMSIAVSAFEMGSPATEPGHQETEGQINVDIAKAFAIGRFEVTLAEFAQFAAETRHAVNANCTHTGKVSRYATWQSPGFEQNARHPVTCITWYDAKAYTIWLSRKSGKTYRLPTESEWEFAARAGSAAAYATGEKLGLGQANIGSTRDGTIPVGFYGANRLGLADMHGNVGELVADCWNPDLSFNATDGRAQILSGNCNQRIMRGGGWDSSIANARSAARVPVADTAASTEMGFRVARTFDEDDREQRLRLHK